MVYLHTSQAFQFHYFADFNCNRKSVKLSRYAFQCAFRIDTIERLAAAVATAVATIVATAVETAVATAVARVYSSNSSVATAVATAEQEQEQGLAPTAATRPATALTKPVAADYTQSSSLV